MKRLTLIASLMFVMAAAWADDQERCPRLFSEQSAISTCRTLLRLNAQTISDDNLRENVSRMVYGKSATESDADILRREKARKEEEVLEEKRSVQSQCRRLFDNNAEELSACRSLTMLTMTVRSDVQMIDAVRERLGKAPITGAERLAVIQTEGSRQEAFAAAQRERERVAEEDKARRAKELARQREVIEINNKKPIPENWRSFLASSNPEDQRLVAVINKMDWWNVCRDYGREMRVKKETRRFVALREYLLANDFINSMDLMNIRERRVAVGMTACGIFASLGIPDKINKTTTANRTNAQIVYRDRGVYVYTEARVNDGNGIVRSIQH